MTEFRTDDIALIASGVAFRATLAIFPAIGVLVWLASRFVSLDQVLSALQSASDVLPQSTRAIIGQAVENQRNGGAVSGGGFGFTGPLLSLLFTLWSANSGAKALFVALNTIFDRTEERSFLRLIAITLLFTGGALAFALLGLAAIVLGPNLLAATGLSEAWLLTWRFARWPLVFIATTAGLSMLYAYAPNHDGRHPYPSITLGSLVSALLLTAAAAAFSWFIAHFASLSLTYGSLSTFIAFMIWLWLSFMLVLAGAEIDAATAWANAQDEDEQDEDVRDDDAQDDDVRVAARG